MKNSATQPRIVASAAKGLIFAALVFLLGIASASSFAGANIQMLPPVTEATKLASSPTPCPPGGAPNILTWDGTNPISCTTGVMVSGGNVGIGTTSPAAPLDLGGKLFFNEGGGNVAVGPDIHMNMAGLIAADDNLYLNIDADNSGTGDLLIGRGSTTTSGLIYLMTIKNSGNVGIGTTSPNSSLDLSQRTDAISMPVGNTSQEPASPTLGMTRYNTDTNRFEFWNGSSWVGNSQWITVPPGTVYSAPSWGGGWVPSANINPTKWCQQNGFSSASGACRSNNITIDQFGNPVPSTYYPVNSYDIVGYVTANTSKGYWAWTCMWGSAEVYGAGAPSQPIYFQAWMDRNSQILCVQ